MRRILKSENLKKSFTPELLAVVVLSMLITFAKFYEVLTTELLVASAVIVLISLIRILEKRSLTSSKKQVKSDRDAQWQKNLPILESNSNRK